jgi:hypothetical protein
MFVSFSFLSFFFEFFLFPPERRPSKKLFFNAWVHLIVIEPTENKAYQLQTTGEWYLLTNKGEKNEFH